MGKARKACLFRCNWILDEGYWNEFNEQRLLVALDVSSCQSTIGIAQQLHRRNSFHQHMQTLTFLLLSAIDLHSVMTVSLRCKTLIVDNEVINDFFSIKYNHGSCGGSQLVEGRTPPLSLHTGWCVTDAAILRVHGGGCGS
jgi:hypothetical protein